MIPTFLLLHFITSLFFYPHLFVMNVASEHNSRQNMTKGFADAIKHEFKSPNYTTRWSDIIELK